MYVYISMLNKCAICVIVRQKARIPVKCTHVA